MSIKERLKELIAKDSLAYSKPDNLFLFLSTALGVKIDSVKKEFDKLIASGEVFEVRKGKYISIPSRGYFKARFIGNSKGFGFAEIGNDSEDVFIPANKTGGAIDGDGVIIRSYFSALSDGSGDGEVVGIFDPVKTVVGTVEKVSKNLFLDPDNTRIPLKFLLKPSTVKCSENQKIVAEVLRGENGKLTARAIEILGDCDDVKALELAIIRDHNLYEEFPAKVIEASKKVIDLI